MVDVGGCARRRLGEQGEGRRGCQELSPPSRARPSRHIAHHSWKSRQGQGAARYQAHPCAAPAPLRQPSTLPAAQPISNSQLAWRAMLLGAAMLRYAQMASKLMAAKPVSRAASLRGMCDWSRSSLGITSMKATYRKVPARGERAGGQCSGDHFDEGYEQESAG